MSDDEADDLDIVAPRRVQPSKVAAAAASGKAPVTMPADPGPVSLWLASEDRWSAFKGKAMLVQDLQRLLEKDKGCQVRIKDKKGTEWNYDSVEIALKFSGAQARRGVRMTTASRKPQQKTWQDIDDDDADDGMDEEAKQKASRLEWDSLSREVNMKKTIEDIASGRRSSVVAYDDVADDEEEADDAPQRPREDALEPGSPGGEAVGSGAADGAAEAEVQGPAAQSGERPTLADGDRKQGDGKRGGKRKPGSQKRREALGIELDENGQPRKKRREDEDEDRWMKLKLEGEEKPKRIDTTRLVSYYDFDSKAAADAAPPVASSSAEGTEVAAAPDFRASVVNLWEDDSNDEEE